MGRFNIQADIIGLKGKEKVNLLVDTGAATSTINKDIADRLGLIKIRDNHLTDFRKKESIISDFDAATIIINRCKSDIFISANKGFPNILGADALQMLDAVIEPEKEKITIRKCEPFQI